MLCHVVANILVANLPSQTESYVLEVNSALDLAGFILQPASCPGADS